MGSFSKPGSTMLMILLLGKETYYIRISTTTTYLDEARQCCFNEEKNIIFRNVKKMEVDNSAQNVGILYYLLA